MSPSAMHEGIAMLFRQRPQLAAELLGSMGCDPLPAFTRATLASETSTPLDVTPFACDALVKLERDGAIVGALIVEIQLGRDPDKRLAWPAYVVLAHRALRAPVRLVVVAIDAAIAEWASRPIPLGPPGFVLRPEVLGPRSVPLVTDAAAAERTPELAVLSALAHAADDDVLHAVPAVAASLACLDEAAWRIYYDLVLARLPAAARAALEAEMQRGTYEYQSDFARKYYGQGREEGRDEGRAEGQASAAAAAVLEVLGARGIAAGEEVAARIRACRDLEQLRIWLRRAATCAKAEELFAE